MTDDKACLSYKLCWSRWLRCAKKKIVKVFPLKLQQNFSGLNTDDCFELVLESLGKNHLAANLG